MRLDWKPVPIRSGPPMNTSLTEREAGVLEGLAIGANVLEVGSAYGYSAVRMGLVADHVLAIDPHEGYGSVADSLQQMRNALRAYNVESRVTIMLGSSAYVLPALATMGAVFELVFVDGDHRRAAVEHDLMWGYKLLGRGGYLAAHDHGEATCPDVAPTCDQLARAQCLMPEVVDTLWVVQKP